jgi:hypothetical protein
VDPDSDPQHCGKKIILRKAQGFENRRKLKNPRFWKKCKDLRKAQGSEESVKFWEKSKILRKSKIL